MTIALLLVAAWVVIGASIGFYEARRGHWTGLITLGALAGPFAWPLARLANLDGRQSTPLVLDAGRVRDEHGLHVVVGIDGSDESIRAARAAAELLGVRLGRLTLATVVDYEADLPPGELTPPVTPHDLARQAVGGSAAGLASWLGFDPATVVLSGRPSTALSDHASEVDADLLVVGTRGRGLSKRLLGSCAEQLAASSRVPVTLIPTDR